jgi:hypothetical protein
MTNNKTMRKITKRKLKRRRDYHRDKSCTRFNLRLKLFSGIENIGE